MHFLEDYAAATAGDVKPSILARGTSVPAEHAKSGGGRIPLPARMMPLSGARLATI